MDIYTPSAATSATKRLPHFSRGVLDWRAPQYLSGARRGSAAPSPRAR